MNTTSKYVLSGALIAGGVFFAWPWLSKAKVVQKPLCRRIVRADKKAIEKRAKLYKKYQMAKHGSPESEKLHKSIQKMDAKIGHWNREMKRLKCFDVGGYTLGLLSRRRR